jgi:peptide/nickel transport system permease protein
MTSASAQQEAPAEDGEPSSGSVTFTDVDLDGRVDDSVSVSAPVVAAIVGGLALSAFYLYDVYVVGGGATVATWDVSRMDWLTMATAVLVGSFVGVPAVRDPSMVWRVWDAYPKNAVSLAALGFVAVFTVVGLVGPALLKMPEIMFDQSRQPPVGTSVPMKHLVSCQGPVVGGHCQGTWAHPLGTTRGGESMLAWLTYGTRTSLQFGLITVAIMAPLAVAVGTTAGYAGGRVDDVLMSYVDIQGAVPAVIVYFFVVFFFGPTLFALVLVFGLFSWEEMARSVRAEVMSEKQEGYVMAAESAGASSYEVVRHHVLPNVSSTVVTSVSTAVPKLILIEALFSFIGLSGDKSYSWGQLIQRGLGFQGPSQLESLWWIPVLPAAAITVTVLLLTLFGDALQTALDPLQEG